METDNKLPGQTNTGRNRPGRATWIGLFIALFGMLIIRQIFRMINPDPGTGVVIVREASYFALAGLLLWLVTHLEKLPLTSIGIGTSVWWKSALWGLVTTVLCGGAAGALVHLTGYGHGQASSSMDRLPLWLIVVIVFRAGIVEELFYRGYAIERLQAVGLARPVAAIVPLILFALAHYTGGVANILIALVLGAILTGFYLWRRDLVANIMAHTMVDLVANVLGKIGK